MAKKFGITFLLHHSIFSINEVPVFSGFTPKDSVYFYSLLLSNYIELLSELENEADPLFCFDKKDIELIPKNFLPDNSQTYFTGSGLSISNLSEINEKHFKKNRVNFVVKFNSIGITPKTFIKTENLLSSDDNSMVICKSISDELVMCGFNKFTSNILNNFTSQSIKFEKFLSIVTKNDIFVNVLGGFTSIKNKDDFKSLYLALSLKESFEFCSEEMHEHFNYLFIEYKEHLK